MTYHPGSTVIVGPDIGSICRAHPNGYAYDVRLSNGIIIVATASAMKPAPENVVVLQRKESTMVKSALDGRSA